MTKEQIISEMWRIFAEGMGADRETFGPFGLDWHSFGYIQGLRAAANYEDDVRELSYFMFDFGAGKVSLEGSYK